jgi:hypothetical protein
MVFKESSERFEEFCFSIFTNHFMQKIYKCPAFNRFLIMATPIFYHSIVETIQLVLMYVCGLKFQV